MNIVHNIVCSVVLSGLLVLADGCSTNQPAVQQALRLAMPQLESERAYLGLSSEQPSFKLEAIQANVLVVDCFDVHSNSSRLEVNRVNQLYRLVQEHGLGDRVRFIGLGVGATSSEVNSYKNMFRVPFPLFPTGTSVVSKSLGPLHAPNVFVLDKQGTNWAFVYSSSGPLLYPVEFFNHLKVNTPHKGWRQLPAPSQDASKYLNR